MIEERGSAWNKPEYASEPLTERSFFVGTEIAHSFSTVTGFDWQLVYVFHIKISVTKTAARRIRVMFRQNNSICFVFFPSLKSVEKSAQSQT